MSKLASLRTVRLFLQLSTEEDEFLRLDDLVNMTQLQELYLTVEHQKELKSVEEGILAPLVEMRRLAICNKVTEFAQFPQKTRAMKHLESLTIRRFVVPSWICELANLKELWLEECECGDYPELQRMPNLVRLDLIGDKRCRQLPKAFGESGGFPQLRLLRISGFSSLEEFPELEEGAMTCLQEFDLVECRKMKKVEGLERLKSLEKLVFSANIYGLLEEDKEYWKKIKARHPHRFITV